MLTALAIALLSQAMVPTSPTGPIFSTPATTGSAFPAPPAFPTAPTALFYAFPVGGFGAIGPMECSGQLVVDANQNDFSAKELTGGTCIRETDGLGVEMGSATAADRAVAVVRIPGTTNHYGPLNEAASANYLLRSYALENASWVSTATVTANVWSGPFSHYRTASGFEQISDTDGAASQCAKQVVATTTAGQYSLSCTMRSGTLTAARLIIAGTTDAAGDVTCAIAGLDATLSRDDRRGCVSGAYGGTVTAITVSICPGANDAATGTIGAVDCQLEKIGHITSYVPTTTVAVSRVAGGATLPSDPPTPVLTMSDSNGCVGSELYVGKYDTETLWTNIAVTDGTARAVWLNTDDTTMRSNSNSSATATLAIGSIFNSTHFAAGGWAADGGYTLWVQDAGSVTVASNGGTQWGTTIAVDQILVENSNGSRDGIVSNITIDSTWNGCRTPFTMANIDRIGWCGDSISANVPVNEKIPAAFFRRSSTNGTSFAHGGDDFAACQAQWSSLGNGTYNRLFLWCGVNDVIVHDTDGTALEATEEAWIREWVYRGVRVNWLDITPFGGYDSTASRLLARTNFNAAQATSCANFALCRGGDGAACTTVGMTATEAARIHCYAVSSLVWDPANHANLLAANTVDGLHPSQQMADIVSTYIATNYP